ncbi:hypothetical protein J2X19_004980 [Rhodoferax ferrireducens]|uniref:Uncharacterized protein n=1 Tax=Rhodoferax ferrireducens TaxID=192843 RepID=A0ABU2CG49_9BURK|nr:MULTISPECIES: hypothetical protein [Rhodoferax]MDR7380278.1 hypothetical protein [Rhodoferax ferrireducens]SDO88045.1 hypothetical protein SAMN05216303_102598 [Rhodoferax sp. OV413]
MTTNTLQLTSTATAPAVNSALRELATAAANLVAAVSASLFQKSAPRALTVFEEAEQVRLMAESYADTDPGFAADLFAAADRHEIQHAAK